MIRPVLLGFFGAAAFALILWLVSTAYTDHERVNAMWVYTNQLAQQQQPPPQQQRPAPTTGAAKPTP